jgi:AcrR family transcriptional regulator
VTRISATDRRSALVRSALVVVAARGVAQATTRAIVAEAGMSLASFHYAFNSRDELIAELVGYVVDREATAILLEEVDADLDHGTHDDHWERPILAQVLRSGMIRYLEHVRADPMHEKAMLELTQYALRDPGLEHLARAQYRRYHALAAEALATAASRSGTVWRLPVADVSRLLVALTDGLTLTWLVDRDDLAAMQLIDFSANSLAALAEPA